MEKIIEREGLITIERWDGSDITTLAKQSNTELEERLSLCDDLGLYAQKKLLPIPYPQLSDAELSILRRFLPTSYHEDWWRGYVFDKIPLTALREIKRAKKLDCFHHLMIRTPEKQVSDPAVIGYDVRDLAYLVTRWGESLKSFEEMEDELSRNKIKTKPRSWIRAMLGVDY